MPFVCSVSDKKKEDGEGEIQREERIGWVED